MPFEPEARCAEPRHHPVQHAPAGDAGEGPRPLRTERRPGVAAHRRRDHQAPAVGGLLLRQRQTLSPLQSHQLAMLRQRRLLPPGRLGLRLSRSLQVPRAAESERKREQPTTVLNSDASSETKGWKAERLKEPEAADCFLSAFSPFSLHLRVTRDTNKAGDRTYIHAN